MKRRFSTIQFQWPFGRTVLFSALCVVFLLAGFECLLRTTWIRHRLPVPMIGSGKASFDITYERLFRLKEDGHSIDVVFVGTSMMKSAVQPVAFQNRFREISGEDIRAFSLSVNLLNIEDMPLLLDVIHKEVQPRVIVMEVSPLADFGALGDRVDGWKLAERPWGRYRLGSWNLRGWIADTFHLYRYALRVHMWVTEPDREMRFKHRCRVIKQHGEYQRNRRYSRSEDLRIRSNLRRVPKDRMGAGPSRQFWRALCSEIPIILLEVPFRETILPVEHLTPASVERFRRHVTRRAESTGLLYVECGDMGSLPFQYWLNMNHLNTAGGSVYSRWFADRLAVRIKEIEGWNR